MLRKQTRKSPHIHMLPSNVQKTQKWLPKSIEILPLLEVFVQVKQQYTYSTNNFRSEILTEASKPQIEDNLLAIPYSLLLIFQVQERVRRQLLPIFLEKYIAIWSVHTFNSTYCVDKKLAMNWNKKTFFLATFKAKNLYPTIVP